MSDTVVVAAAVEDAVVQDAVVEDVVVDAAAPTDDGPAVESLIEEISIDGMCGVY